MAALYSWLKGNNQETKKHISHGGETLCGYSIPSRHSYTLITGSEICLRCQKAFVSEAKEKYGSEWKESFESSFAPDITI